MQFEFSSFDWSDDDTSPFDDWGDNSSSSLEEEPVCAQPCTTRTRTIRFAEDDEVFEHIALAEYEEEEKNATWFRPHEFREIRSQIQDLVGQLEQQQQQPETEFFTMRGLEDRTSVGGMKRGSNKREAYAAVLEEQQRQWRSGRGSVDRIAAAYQIVASKCQGMAMLKGIQDDHEVREFLRSQPTATTTTTSSSASRDPVKPYEEDVESTRLAILEDIKILSSRGEAELSLSLHSSPAAA